MNRRNFLRRAGIVTVVSSAGVAGCLDVGGGGDGGDGDGGSGSDGGDGSGDGSNGDGGSGDGSGDGGSDGDGSGSDGGSGETATPTATATAAPSGNVGAGTRAPYDQWASSSVYSAEEVQASTVDMQALQEMSQSSTPTPTPGPQSTQGQIDPVLAFPMVHLLSAAFSGFALAGFGVGNVVGENGSTENVHSVGNALVFEGSFDPESLATAITESQASESGSYEGYTLYSQGSGDDTSILGVSGETLITTTSGDQVSDPQAVVEAAIDASAGNAPSYGADHGAYEDLVTALATSPIMGLSFSPQGSINEQTPTPTPTPAGGGGGGDFFNVAPFELEGDLRGYASSLTFSQAEQSATAEMALRYASAGEVDDRSLIESQAAPKASDLSVQIDGPMVLVSASYSDTSAL